MLLIGQAFSFFQQQPFYFWLHSKKKIVLQKSRIPSIEQWSSFFTLDDFSFLAILDFEGEPWQCRGLGTKVHWLLEFLALYSDQQYGFYRGKLERAPYCLKVSAFPFVHTNSMTNSRDGVDMVRTVSRITQVSCCVGSRLTIRAVDLSFPDPKLTTTLTTEASVTSSCIREERPGMVILCALNDR